MQVSKLKIKDWAEDDRPREKLLSNSPEILSDSELLAILIGQGNRERSALDLARDVLSLGQNDLSCLGRMPVRDLMNIRGIGLAKAVCISAALELGRRRQKHVIKSRNYVRHSHDIADFLQSRFRDLPHEVFAVLFLNRANRINHFEIISRGGITGTVADPRIILRKALEAEAVNLILCHNHPSGSLRPSRADEEVTSKIKDAARHLDIRVLDHIIVSEEGYFSFADEGMI